MEERANHVLTILRANKMPDAYVLGLVNGIKADIKHGAVPQGAIGPIFEIINAVLLSTPAYVDAGFSTLHHLLRRLHAQDQMSSFDHHARRIIPVVLESLSVEKERLRTRALQALVDLFSSTPTAASIIRSMISDAAVQYRGPTTKLAVMQLIAKVSCHCASLILR